MNILRHMVIYVIYECMHTQKHMWTNRHIHIQGHLKTDSQLYAQV